VFRELAVSYMGRFDLAHVDPSESNFDAIGKGVEEGRPPEQASSKYLSKGLTRSRTDNLVVMRGTSVPSTGAGRDERSSLAGSASDASRGGVSDAHAVSSPSPLAGEGRGGGSSRVTSLASHGPTARATDATEGAVALKQEAQHGLSPTEKLEAMQWSKAGAAASAAPSKAERRAEAKAKGYEGEMCSECGNFTLVRNGTCMKCDTCGSTTGCS
jgi:ribonucleoside-diphosphate reductase alpha chain